MPKSSRGQIDFIEFDEEKSGSHRLMAGIRGSNLGFTVEKIHIFKANAEEMVMKNHDLPSLKLRIVLIFVSLFIGAQAALAQDIDDIEVDMESALSESEAAINESEAAKAREQEERASLNKEKREAEAAKAKARAKEVSAKREIKDLEAKIAMILAEKKQHELAKAEAEKKILFHQGQVDKKRIDFEQVQALNQAAKEERLVQENALKKLVDEQKNLETQIINNRAQTKALEVEIARLKTQAVEREKTLVRVRENAKKEAELKAKKAEQKAQAKRNVSSVPGRVLFRNSKLDCDVVSAASDGAGSIGSIKAGSRQELYRVVNLRWVQIKYGDKRGYVSKSCF